MSYDVIVYGRTDTRTDARWTKCDHKSSPCHNVTGELKKSFQDEVAQMLRNAEVKQGK